MTTENITPAPRGRPRKPEIVEAMSMDDVMPLPPEPATAKTLRQRMKELPAKGMPFNVRIDGVDTAVWPGEWREIYEDERTGLPKNCPVTPLGKMPGNAGFAFLDPLGSVYVLKPSAGKGEIDAMFSPFTAYLPWAWPRKHVKKSKDEEKEIVDNYHAEDARTALFDAAGVFGTFDPQGIVRGRGCWRDDDGTLIYHAGDAVLVGTVWKKPGRIGEYIYPSKRAIGRPLNDPNDWEAAQRMLEVLRTFNWERPGVDPELMLGWLASARLGAALLARPSVWVTGQEGSGKSLLFKANEHFMGRAIVTAADASAAMIYQTLKEDVVAVLLDEQEAESDPRRATAIVKLARVSYSGGVLGRGGQDGAPVGYQLRSSFFFSSIARPPIKSQDETRMIDLSLSPQRADQKNEEPDMGEIAEWGAMIMGRLVKRFDKLDGMVRTVKAFLRENGYDTRGADTLGTIIACYHLACFDADISVDDLREWVRKMPPPAKTVTWQRMVAFMLETRPEEFRDPKIKDKSLEAILMTLKEDLSLVVAPIDVVEAVKTANRNVRPFGMFFDFSPDAPGSTRFEDLELFIPNGHAGMVSLMAGSDWAGLVGTTGPWAGVLKQAGQAGVARDSGKPVKKNNAKSVRGHFLHIDKALKSFE